MKYLLVVLFIIGCSSPKPKELVLIEVGGNGEVDSITLVKDTLRVYKKVLDTLSLKFDSTWKVRYKGEDSFDIKIESHNGDVLTGRSVKNVYNNKK